MNATLRTLLGLLIGTSLFLNPLHLRAAANVALSCDTIYGGTIGEPGEQHRYEFTAAAGDLLLFDSLELSPQQFQVTVAGPGGSVAALSGTAKADKGPFYVSVPGEHLLGINVSTDATGDYGFRLLNLGRRRKS